MRVRTLVTATVIAASSTLGLTGFAAASTPEPPDGRAGAERVVERSDAGSVQVEERHRVDGERHAATPGWVVDDNGRVIARTGWRVDDRGRIVVARRVIAERGWIVVGRDHVVAARPADRADTVVRGERCVDAVQARPSRTIRIAEG
ncbi:hypothetical protein [Pseudonocardia sp. TRM90224]|uniref:hypothetical protein n=1 Tax=Pseudonocardia sp. TRM90224 TaxID=2812678 RepID=UPI001E50FC67|nr:hypothetical protein [Pseudonocardia sp. TRM90224]